MSRTYRVRFQYRLHGGIMLPVQDVEAHATYRAALNYLVTFEKLFRLMGMNITRTRAMLEAEDHDGFTLRIWFEQER